MIAISNAISIGLNRLSGGAPGPDPDAQAFFSRVTAAGGTLTTAERNAVNQLVLDLKANSLWAPMKAIYPMVGASAAACAQNLKSSSFTGTFSSGWTFASTGVTPNGTSAYMNTNCSPNQMSSISIHLSVYNRTESNAGVEIGSTILSNDCQLVSRISGSNFSYINQTTGTGFLQSASTGFVIAQRTNSTERLYYRNNAKTTTADAGTTANSIPLYLCARNNNGVAGLFDARQKAFASIGDGLTDTQATALYNAVQTMNTTLSRQV